MITVWLLLSLTVLVLAPPLKPIVANATNISAPIVATSWLLFSFTKTFSLQLLSLLTALVQLPLPNPAVNHFCQWKLIAIFF